MTYRYRIEGCYEDPDTNEETYKSFAECNELTMALEIRDLYQNTYEDYCVWILKFDSQNDVWDELSIKEVAYNRYRNQS